VKKKPIADLLKNKALNLILGLALLSFVVLYVVDTQFPSASQFSNLLRSLAIAFLTSGVVGFTFEYFTRYEFFEGMSEVVSREMDRVGRNLWGRANDDSALFEFWRSFFQNETVIWIAQDQRGDDPVVRSCDITSSLSLFTGIIEQFSLPVDRQRVKIKFIDKETHPDQIPANDSSVIVAAAPGANPVATWIMEQAFGKPSANQPVKNGYIFATETARQDQYLKCPFVLNSPDLKPGIWEVKDGQYVHNYERFIAQKGDAVSKDCCLILSATFEQKEKNPIQVLLIAGHSRYATWDGVNYVLTNEDWAKKIKTLKTTDSVSILSITSTFMDRKVVLAQPPRPIQTRNH
jgi:hypothetical protein